MYKFPIIHKTNKGRQNKNNETRTMKPKQVHESISAKKQQGEKGQQNKNYEARTMTQKRVKGSRTTEKKVR